MTLPLIAFLIAAIVPLFFGTIRTAPFWLSVQALALGWNILSSGGPWSGHTLVALSEVLILRAVVAPALLRRAIRLRGDVTIDLIPSNLFAWAIATALIVLAFEFGAPSIAGLQSWTLGAVGATAAAALLLLATNASAAVQLTAILLMENALALFESLLPEPWPLPVHGSLSLIYFATASVGGWLIGVPSTVRAARGSARPEAPGHAAPDAPLQPPVREPLRHAWVGPVLVTIALAAMALSVLVFVRTPVEAMPRYFAGRYFVLDPTSMLFLLVINGVFLGISVYMASRVSASRALARTMLPRATLSLAFMVAMNLGVMANHLLLLWASIELTTLCAAPLVAQGSGPGARRAAWHYLLYSSISLALTFLGIMCLTRSAHLHGLEQHFALDEMAASIASPGDSWQRLGLALMLFGLGSKLGLAPLYNWMPETYEAAPTSTSALLAAVQFNVSIVAVFRILQVFRGHDIGFVSYELLIMGALSLTVAAVQIMASRNYTRLIAYACVSSSGVIAIGLSVGNAASYGVLLYVVSNAFVKALLFLTAGRLRAVYRTNQVAALSGVIRVLPFAGLLFTVGIFALLGFPPFGSFMAEMLVLSGIVRAGNLIAFTLLCTTMTVIFVATGRSIFPMIWGPGDQRLPPVNESWMTAVPKLGFVVTLVLLGVYTPGPVSALLLRVAQSIGGQ